MTEIFVVLVLLVLAGVAGYGLWASRVEVPEDHVGIVKRGLLGRKDHEFPRIAPGNTKGVQARTLKPGQVKYLLPFLYTVEFAPRVHVEAGMIGLVTAEEGRQRPARSPLGTYVECDNFQDGQAFLRGGGQQGDQVATLDGDSSYFINTRLFKVQIVPRVYVPAGTIGLIEARAGRTRPSDQPFGRHVDCDSFQDGQEFLTRGGEQGRQLAILTGPAYYDINPKLFRVITVDNVDAAQDGLTREHLQQVVVPTGNVGVVITLDGDESRPGIGHVVNGHRNFRLPWVFIGQGGTRGVQEETMGENAVYALNPWFVRVVLIPTRVLILEWNNKSPSQAQNYDTELERITVTVQGYRLHVDMSQTLKIPAASAPMLVSEFGGTGISALGGLVHDPLPIRRFVERVLGSTVEGYFNGIAVGSTLDEFVRKFAETRTEVAAQVTTALEGWKVEAIHTQLSLVSEDPKLNERLQGEANEQMRGRTLQVTRDIIDVEDEIDEVRARADRRRAALELQATVDALGMENVSMIKMIDSVAKMNVPGYIGGDIGAAAEFLPMNVLRDLVGRVREMRAEHSLTSGERPELKAGEE